MSKLINIILLVISTTYDRRYIMEKYIWENIRVSGLRECRVGGWFCFTRWLGEALLKQVPRVWWRWGVMAVLAREWGSRWRLWGESALGVFKRNSKGADVAGTKTGGRWGQERRTGTGRLCSQGEKSTFNSKGDRKPWKCFEQRRSTIWFQWSKDPTGCSSELPE